MFHTDGWRAKVAENQRNRKTGEDASDQKNFESENGIATEHFGHDRRRVRRRTQANQHAAQYDGKRKPEKFFHAKQTAAQENSHQECPEFDFKSVTVYAKAEVMRQEKSI